MSEATYCISKSLSFEMAGRPGEYHTFYPKGQNETILSINLDGTLKTCPKGSGGAWETWKPSKDGLRAVFYETGEVYAFPLVD